MKSIASHQPARSGRNCLLDDGASDEDWALALAREAVLSVIRPLD